MIGRTLAHYRILEKLGSGGMGEVYVAEDTKLSRKVAFKVLPEEMATGERLSRFEREAKAIAALNHPNIVTVFSVEEAEGVHFITMELVRGKTLAELLPKNGFPLSKFFDIAIPLSDAVAAAHQEGITHRDLKPDNTMVGEDGRVKVLDFGLAKPAGGFAGTGAVSELPTVAKTQEGAIVGTVNYMSPEQAAGKAVDPRSDIFSLGIVFYEMLTGRRPFGGDTHAEVLSSIIRETPRPVQELRDDVPRELSKMVQRCLAKELTRRAQNALDIRNDLEELKAELSSGELQQGTRLPVRSSVNKWLAVASVLLLLVLVGVLLQFGLSQEPTLPRLVNPVQVTSVVGVENYPTWSPDGGRLAYESNQTGNRDIWVTQLGGGEPVNLTEGHDGRDQFPSWSPNGRQIAYLSRQDDAVGLYTVSALGGTPRRMMSLQGALGVPQWSADGTEIAVSDQDSKGNFVAVVTLQTQATRRLELPDHDGNPCRDLSWSPNGNLFAYVDAIPAAEITQLWVVSSSGGNPTPVTEGQTNEWNPTWSADGRKLYFASNRGGSMDLWQQLISKDGKPEGDPQPVTTGVEIRSAVFSPDGTKLAYSRGRWVSNLWRVPILSDRVANWGDAEQITFDNAFLQFFDLSPDGQRLAVSSDRAGNQDLWILPSGGGEMVRLTTDPTPDWQPRWSPDATEIAFYAYRSGNRDVWVMPSSGGPARQLTSHPSAEVYVGWSPDGRYIAFDSWRSGNRDVWIVEAQGGEPRQVTTRPASDVMEAWTPDGQWLTVNSERSFWRVSVSGGEPELLTRGPGNGASWSPDGKLMYYNGAGERDDSLWAFALDDRREYRVADLTGRRGSLSGATSATDGSYLYFGWQNNLGDIWVMDVVQGE